MPQERFCKEEVFGAYMFILGKIRGIFCFIWGGGGVFFEGKKV
jgi:hypothetical protein